MPKQKIVLLIDDNPLLTGMYSAAFERKGLEVLVAHSGEDGLELARRQKPNLILLDILMPGIDGFGVLERLKGDLETKDIMVVVLTVVQRKEHEERAKKLGAAAYLVKSEGTLNEIVERILQYLPNHEHK